MKLLFFAATGAAVVALALAGGASTSDPTSNPTSNPTSDPALDPTPDPTPAVWEEPADYSYRVFYGIFGPVTGTYDITVRDHSVTAVDRLPEPGFPEFEPWLTVENAWTLADLEAKYFEVKAREESDATITYDTVTGAPVTLFLDWIVLAADDEEYFSILAFDPNG